MCLILGTQRRIPQLSEKQNKTRKRETLSLMLAINIEQTTFVEGSGSWKNFKNSVQFTGV